MTDEQLAENDALAKALSFPGHVDHFAAWFKDGKKVRHGDEGGIQCLCGWSAPADSKGYRPWDAWYAHLADVFVASGWRAIPPEPERCSTCGESFDSPPCSLNRDIGWSGHTRAGGVAAGISTPPGVS